MTSRKRGLITRPHGTASSRTPSSVATRKKAKPIYTGRPVLSGDMCAVVALSQKRYSKKVHRLAHFSPSPLSFLRFLSVPFSLSGDRVRAIENGFTLLRCSSDGVSAVVSPLGETIAFRLDTAGPQHSRASSDLVALDTYHTSCAHPVSVHRIYPRNHLSCSQLPSVGL